jgi:predicted HTH domain antitoxin
LPETETVNKEVSKKSDNIKEASLDTKDKNKSDYYSPYPDKINLFKDYKKYKKIFKETKISIINDPKISLNEKQKIIQSEIERFRLEFERSSKKLFEGYLLVMNKYPNRYSLPKDKRKILAKSITYSLFTPAFKLIRSIILCKNLSFKELVSYIDSAENKHNETLKKHGITFTDKDNHNLHVDLIRSLTPTKGDSLFNTYLKQLYTINSLKNYM